MSSTLINHVGGSLHEGSYVLRLARKLGGTLFDFSSKALVKEGLRKAGVRDAARIFTFTKPQELETLYQLARGCPEQSAILEIGSYLGASSCYLGAGIKQRGGTLFCVDTWHNQTMPEGEQDTFAQFRNNTAGMTNTVVAIRKRSVELTANDLRFPLELVFIDGDHSYDAVKADFETIRPWLADEAVVAFHDFVAYEGVRRLVGEVLASGSFRPVGQVKNLCWIRKMKSATESRYESKSLNHHHDLQSFRTPPADSTVAGSGESSAGIACGTPRRG
jgi:predicted O-methyltransferase YrrM